MTFKKYIVVEPSFFKQLITKCKESETKNKDLNLLQRIIQNRKLNPSTKWGMYSKILNKYDSSLPNKSERLESRELKDVTVTEPITSRKRKGLDQNQIPTAVKAKRKYTRKPKLVESSVQTSYSEPQTKQKNSPTLFQEAQKESIFESVPESPVVISDESEINDFPDQSLEAFMYELAQKEAEQDDPKKIIRRESTINSNTRVFDDLDTGAVISIDSDMARDKLYGERNTSTPVKQTNKKLKRNKNNKKFKIKLPNWENLKKV